MRRAARFLPTRGPLGLLVVGLVVTVTATGCLPASEPGARPSSRATSAAASPRPSATPRHADLATVALRDGVPITSQEVTVRVLAAATPRALDDGSVRVDLAAVPTGPTPGGATPPPPGAAVVVAVPAPLRLEVLPDGTALVRDGDTAVAGLRADPTGRLEADGDAAVLTAHAEPTALWFTARSILQLAWGEREGGRSLAVTPADWTRAGGAAAQELAAAQLVAAQPEAGTATMLAQLACHQLGARSKSTWNLEPWRPDVEWFEMIAARCNPT